MITHCIESRNQLFKKEKRHMNALRDTWRPRVNCVETAQLSCIIFYMSWFDTRLILYYKLNLWKSYLHGKKKLFYRSHSTLSLSRSCIGVSADQQRNFNILRSFPGRVFRLKSHSLEWSLIDIIGAFTDKQKAISCSYGINLDI